MGNAQSQQKKSADLFFNEELINSIDLLASKLIFEQSFQNLKKLDELNTIKLEFTSLNENELNFYSKERQIKVLKKIINNLLLR